MKIHILLATMLTISCLKVEVRAPKDTTMQLSDQELSALEKTSRKTRKKNWYIFSGLIAVNDNSTKRIIPENCTKVALTTSQTLGDMAISTLTPAIGIVMIGVALRNSVERLLNGGGFGDQKGRFFLGVGLGLSFTIFPPVRTTTQALCVGKTSTASMDVKKWPDSAFQLEPPALLQDEEEIASETHTP